MSRFREARPLDLHIILKPWLLLWCWLGIQAWTWLGVMSARPHWMSWWPDPMDVMVARPHGRLSADHRMCRTRLFVPQAKHDELAPTAPAPCRKTSLFLLMGTAIWQGCRHFNHNFPKSRTHMHSLVGFCSFQVLVGDCIFWAVPNWRLSGVSLQSPS